MARTWMSRIYRAARETAATPNVEVSDADLLRGLLEKHAPEPLPAGGSVDPPLLEDGRGQEPRPEALARREPTAIQGAIHLLPDDRYNHETIPPELNEAIGESITQYVTPADAHRLRVCPYKLEGSTLWLATCEPPTLRTRGALAYLTNDFDLTPDFTRVPRPVFERLLRLYYTDESDEKVVGDIHDLEALYNLGSSEEQNVITLQPLAPNDPRNRLYTILIKGVLENASDISFWQYKTVLNVKYVIDGKGKLFYRLPAALSSIYVNAIKTMCEQRTDQKKLFQGTLRVKFDRHGTRHEVLFRVNIKPTHSGQQSITLRVQHQSLQKVDFAELDARLPRLGAAIRRAKIESEGLYVCSGPMNSGKSTLLYSIALLSNPEEYPTVALEKPIEFDVDQMLTHDLDELGLSWTDALAAVLKDGAMQILIGETSDRNTAIAVAQAALTGHKVFTSVHAASAVSTIKRLLNLGIEHDILAQALRLICCMRMLPTLCSCSVDAFYAPEHLIAMGFTPEEALNVQLKTRKPGGCSLCLSTGVLGRMPVHEFLEITPELEMFLHDNEKPPYLEIQRMALQQGMVPMRRVALDLAVRGKFCLEDVEKRTRWNPVGSVPSYRAEQTPATPALPPWDEDE